MYKKSTYNEEWDKTAEIKKIKKEEIEIKEGKIEESDTDTGEVGTNEVEVSNHLVDCK